jgi:hypothetical protein
MSPAAHLPFHQQRQMRHSIPPIWRLLSPSWSGPSPTPAPRWRTGARPHRAAVRKSPNRRCPIPIGIWPSPRFFGTSERFWINLQARYDLEAEKDRLGDALDGIRPLSAAS